jgi:hypothetical protein
LGLLLNLITHLFDILPRSVRRVFTARAGETEQRYSEEHDDETIEVYGLHNLLFALCMNKVFYNLAVDRRRMFPRAAIGGVSTRNNP